jgi:hypothetical protein
MGCPAAGALEGSEVKDQAKQVDSQGKEVTECLSCSFVDDFRTAEGDFM